MKADDSDAWLRKAAEDGAVILALIALESPPYSMVCYHAQQAAEKTLKAFLVSKGLNPPRTHDLVRLLSLCQGAGIGPSEITDDCEFLLRFAASSRYPGEDADPTREEALLCVEAVQRVLDFVQAQIDKA